MSRTNRFLMFLLDFGFALLGLALGRVISRVHWVVLQGTAPTILVLAGGTLLVFRLWRVGYRQQLVREQSLSSTLVEKGILLLSSLVMGIYWGLGVVIFST